MFTDMTCSSNTIRQNLIHRVACSAIGWPFAGDGNMTAVETADGAIELAMDCEEPFVLRTTPEAWQQALAAARAQRDGAPE